MEAEFPGLPIVLVLFLVVDALACAIPLGYASRRFDAVDCPARVRVLVPWIEVAAAVGLSVGLWVPAVGVVTGACLTVYYVIAVGFHFGARDRLVDALPAIVLLVAAVIVTLISFLPPA